MFARLSAGTETRGEPKNRMQIFLIGGGGGTPVEFLHVTPFVMNFG